MINHALQKTPEAGTHWSTRTLARAEGVGKSTVQRWFALFGVEPHLAKTFKLSTDPLCIEKVRAVVGLYLNPPESAVVLCVDEKSQIQALNRTQPALPMSLGCVEGCTHDSSWLNQVERWFGLLGRRAIARVSFRSVPDLVSRRSSTRTTPPQRRSSGLPRPGRSSTRCHG